MNYYLGVDVGTSSVKSLLMDSEGKTVGTSQIGYDIIKEKLQYGQAKFSEKTIFSLEGISMKTFPLDNLVAVSIDS